MISRLAIIAILCSLVALTGGLEEPKCHGIEFSGDTHFYIQVKDDAPIINNGNFRTQALILGTGKAAKIYHTMEIAQEKNRATSLEIHNKSNAYTFYKLLGTGPEPNFVRYVRCLVTPIHAEDFKRGEVTYLWLGATNCLKDEKIDLPSGNTVSGPHWKMAIKVKVVEHAPGAQLLEIVTSDKEATLLADGWKIASGEFQELNVGGKYPLVGLASGKYSLHLYDVRIARAK